MLAGDSGGAGIVCRCACRHTARVSFVPSVGRPKAVSLVRISVTGNFTIRQSAVDGCSWEGSRGGDHIGRGFSHCMFDGLACNLHWNLGNSTDLFFTGTGGVAILATVTLHACNAILYTQLSPHPLIKFPVLTMFTC